MQPDWVLHLMLLACLIQPVLSMSTEINSKNLEEITKKAQAGDTSARIILGNLYTRGIFVEKDDEKAVVWYRRAAESGSPESIYSLAWFLNKTAKTRQAEAEAATFFAKAAQMGHMKAQYYLGVYHLEGRGNFKQDIETGVRELKKSAEKNYLFANVKLVYLNRDGFCDDKTAQTALARIRQIASGSKDPKAYYYLGKIHEKGISVPVDLSMALMFYQKAAQMNHPESLYRMAKMIEDGRELEKDVKRAKTYYEAAFRNGLRKAGYDLGRMSETGIAGKQDLKAAIEYYHSSALNGVPESMAALGRMLLDGKSVERNIQAASRWLEASANKGIADAQYLLGTMYRDGMIPERPIEQAPDTPWYNKKNWKPGGFNRHWSQHWFQQAADQGHIAAAKEIRHENVGKGASFVIIGGICLLIALRAFFKQEPFIRFVSAPLCLIFALAFLIQGIRLLVT